MMTTSPLREGLEPGSRIGRITKHPDYRQIFMFSAITWNRHLIHYNQQQARHEGHRDVVVQRALLGNYLAQCVSAWIGERGALTRLEWKVRQSAFAGDELTCQGEVREKNQEQGHPIVVCALEILNQNKDLIVDATATVRLRAPESGGGGKTP